MDPFDQLSMTGAVPPLTVTLIAPLLQVGHDASRVLLIDVMTGETYTRDVVADVHPFSVPATIKVVVTDGETVTVEALPRPVQVYVCAPPAVSVADPPWQTDALFTVSVGKGITCNMIVAESAQIPPLMPATIIVEVPTGATVIVGPDPGTDQLNEAAPLAVSVAVSPAHSEGGWVTETKGTGTTTMVEVADTELVPLIAISAMVY